MDPQDPAAVVAAEVHDPLDEFCRAAHARLDSGADADEPARIEAFLAGLGERERAAAEPRVAVLRARWLQSQGEHAAAAALASERWTFEELRALPASDRAHLAGVLAACAPADERFRLSFLRFVRATERARSAAELEVLFELLTIAAGWIDELTPELRDRTRFFVGTRLADIRLRQERFDDAAAIARTTRERAMRDAVFSGHYRATLLLILWQTARDADRDALLDAEREFIEREADALFGAPDEFRNLQLPLRLMRCALRFRDGDEARGLGELEDVVAVALASHAVEDHWRIVCLTQIVWHCLLRSDYDRAELYLAELPPRLATYPRGLIALRRGDFDLALRAGQTLARQNPRYRHLVGEALEAKGEFAAAAVEYRAVLDNARERGDRGDRMLAQRGLGDCELGLASRESDAARRRAHADAARGHYDAALATGTADPHAAAERVQILSQLGRALELAGDPAAASDSYRSSLELLDAERRGVAADPFGGSWLTEAYLSGVDGVLRLSARLRSDGCDVLAAVELAKARTLLDWIASPPDTAGAASELRLAARGLTLTEDPADLDRQRRAIEDARRRTAASSPGAGSLDAAALSAWLRARPDGTVLSYWLGADHAWLCVARAAGVEVVELGATATALAKLAAAHAAVADAGSLEHADVLADAAAFFVPARAREAMRGADPLVFCPDARLGRLPFEALPVDGRAIGVAHAVERAASLSVCARLEARRPRGDRVALVDSVAAAGDERQLGLDPLEFSAREAELVAAAYGARVTRLSGDGARLAGVRDLLAGGRFDLVHISAHAIANPYLPTASLLLLGDGPAPLPSLIDIDLDGAVLVLSACSSATGEARGGEGEIGLLGWPFAGGARAAVASLWRVNQQATADLMGQFHAFRAAGHGEAEAMRRAREVLAAAPQYAHPHYWAGFGVWSATRPARAAVPWPSLLAAAIVLLAGAVVARRMRRASPRV